MTTGIKTAARKNKAWLKHMQAGQRAFQQRKLRDATRAFSRATRVEPGNVAGWVNLGSAYLESGDYRESCKALSYAIELAPAVMTSYMLLGDALRLLGNLNESLAAYEHAVVLERSPQALNRLACALRSVRQTAEARALYLEAIRTQPEFTLAQVNLATLQLECDEFDRAEGVLAKLQAAPLPAAERAEVEGAIRALAEYRRLAPGIEAMNSGGDLAPLEALLRDLPAGVAAVDSQALDMCRAYRNVLQGTPLPQSLPLIPLPANWPLIEGLFMIPVIHTVSELRDYEKKIERETMPSGELLESINMRDAILEARLAHEEISDPVKLEVHLRHWHAISARGVPGLSPGHFKYTQNWCLKSPALKRVEPALASATLQHFLRDIYPGLPAGLVRAAVCFLVLCDLHCFADGNGRVALTWINRQLEWNGEMPMLFTRELGMQGQLGEAKRLARERGGDPGPVIEVMQRGQQFAQAFFQQQQ